MDTIKLEQLMSEYNHKLDEIIKFNKDAALKSLKLKKLNKETISLLFYRIFEAVFYGFIVLFIGYFVAGNWHNPHFAISGIIVEIFALIALIGSIGQIVLVNQIDYSGPIVEIRKKIELVNAHSFLFFKLILLSIPVWWAYAIVGLYLIFGFDVYSYLEPGFAESYLIVNGLLIIPLLWFLSKLSYRNLHKNWVRKIIETVTSRKLKKALSFLKSIEAFEH